MTDKSAGMKWRGLARSGWREGAPPTTDIRAAREALTAGAKAVAMDPVLRIVQRNLLG